MSEESSEQKRKLPIAVIVGIILAAICGISLYIRIALPYDQVFVDGAVWFKGTDAWYHMRYIENLVHHFPHVSSFDPYRLYPGGSSGLARPFFDLLTAAIINLVSFGSPTQNTINTVGALMPPILATVTLIPVYFIGKELFNRWVGLIAATLVAILPGEFLNRSLLGFTDHHAAEALFSTVAVLFLILALKRIREREISFTHLVNRDWSTITRPLIYILLAGIFLGIYLLTWQGGLLLIFIIFAYLLIQFIVDHLGHKSTDYLCIVGSLSFLIAFLMLLPALGKAETMYRVSLVIAIVIPIALCFLSRFMAGRNMRPTFYPLALMGFAGIGVAIFYAVDSALLHLIFRQFGIFAPSGAAMTILERHPLLFPQNNFSLNIAWLNFTTTFFISFVALGMLIYDAVKNKSSNMSFFLVWSIVMLLAVLGQRRFSYYFAINAALLTGYFSWRILDFAGLKELLARPQEAVVKEFKKRKKQKAKAKAKAKVKESTFMQPRAAWVRVIIAGVVVFFLVFFPNFNPNSNKVKAIAEQPPLINQGWYSALQWLGGNSPEPFTDPDYYYASYPPKSEFEYPETAYGVMSWWDYGYWIMRISQRVPNANPSQANADKAATFFISQDEVSANEIRDKMGSKYVMIDYAMPTSKFYAMPEWAGKSKEEYMDTYYRTTEEGTLQAMTLFYPDYFRSMVVRLYNFNGKAVNSEETVVISYEAKVSREGVKFKHIIESWSFPTYEGAEAYIAGQESGNYKIVSGSPFTSPLPLEELNNYEMVYESPARVKVADQTVPIVKIFEYL